MSLAKNIIEKITAHVRTCANCGSIYANQFCLCATCMLKILTNEEVRGFKIDQQYIHIEQEKYKYLSLFNWEPNKHRPISMMIDSLKLGKIKSDYIYLAELFTNKVLFNKQIDKTSTIISVPSKSGKEDHAVAFAKALSKILGLKQEFPLVYCGEKIQKSLKKQERIIQNSIKCEKFTRIEGPIILVDDVVTTGSTAYSCYKALGRPNKFEVWTIARRQLASKT